MTVNETKSAVASVFGRKFLGYSFWVAPGGVIKRKVAVKPLMTFKQRIRQLTCRSGGRSMQDVVDRLRPYVRGWKAYFRLAQTPRVWRELDQWVRHRLRAIQLKQWKRGTTMYRELLVLGAKLDVARQVVANSRRWWRNSGMLLNAVLTLNWSDRLGTAPALMTSTSRTARCGPACRVVWQGSDPQGRPLCRLRSALCTHIVIASVAKQSSVLPQRQSGLLRRKGSSQ
ncbi:hypothetical protein ACVWXO_010946 [Bradyrhizobium sp. LM2.7]